MKSVALFLASFIFVVSIGGCSRKPSGFGIADSPIRFETAQFSDPEVLAEVGKTKFYRSSILEKSQVLKDLALQENESLVGLAYLEAHRLQTEGSAKGESRLRVQVPVADPNIGHILARFGKEPSAKLLVDFRGEADPKAHLHAPSPSQIIAIFGSREIKRSDLNTNHFVFQSIEQRRFFETAQQLNSQVARILISIEALADKKDLTQFLKDRVFGDLREPTDQDLDQHLKKIGFAKEELTPELASRFKESIKQRQEQAAIESFVAKNIIRGPLKVAFSEPKAQFAINKNFTPITGYTDAPISMVVFSGATCQDCKETIAGIYDAAREFDGYLKINWIHQTQAADGFSNMFAEASLCVDSQRRGKSLKFLRDLAAQSSEVSEEKFYSWAKDNNLNPEGLKDCILQGTSRDLLSQHNAFVAEMGIVANPTIWVDGTMLEGNVSEQALKASIENKILEVGASPLAAFFRRIKNKIGL